MCSFLTISRRLDLNAARLALNLIFLFSFVQENGGEDYKSET